MYDRGDKQRNHSASGIPAGKRRLSPKEFHMEEKVSILIVDDDDDLSQVLERLFAGEGYATATAFTGHEALNRARAGFFNLAFLDINLPDIKGVDLVPELKKMHPDMVLIMVTGYASLDNAVKALNEGASYYFRKPLKIDEILTVVRESLEKQALILENRHLCVVAEKELRSRKEIDGELKKSEARLRKIIDKNADGIILITLDGIVRFVNPAAESMIGRTARQLLGEMFGLPLVGGESTEIEIVSKTGGLRIVELRTAEMEWEGETVYLASLRDISARKQAEQKLARRERYFRSLLMHMHEDIMVIDPNYIITDINDNVIASTRLSREAVVGRRCYEVLHGYDAPCSRGDKACGLQEVIDSGKSCTTRQMHRHTDSSVTWVDLLFSPLKDPEGRVTHVIEAARDVSEMIEAEEALRESEKKYRTLFEDSADALHITTLDGRFVDVNRAFVELFGYTREELGKLDIHTLYLEPRERKRFTRAVCAKGYIRNYATVFRKKNGTLIDCLQTASERRNKRNETVGFQGIIRDITEAKKAEKKIRQYSRELESMVEERTHELHRALFDTEEARDRIDGILKSVGDGLIVTDMYNRVTLMNRSAEDLLGVYLSEVIHRPIDFAVHDRTWLKKIKAVLGKNRSGTEFDFELPGGREEHPRVMRAITTALADRNGRQTGSVTIMRDVTHEREVDRMKTEFLSTAAHELRTPLTSIRGFSEILLVRENLDLNERSKFLSYINNQAVALSEIINDLLDIARIESGRGFSIEKENCTINGIVNAVVPFFRGITAVHRFDVDLPREAAPIFADRGKMEQAVKNIISNAVKYSPEGGVIHIRSEKSKGHYRLEIRDTGIGMTAEQVGNVFNKFYRADSSDRAPEGTGLGMTLVKHIIEGHGGKVWVESVYGKGTGVTLTIPAG